MSQFLPDIPALAELTGILAPIARVSTLLQSNSPTMCMAAHEIHRMMGKLKKHSRESEICADFASKLLNELAARFGEELQSSASPLLKASLFFPRNKIPHLFTEKLLKNTWLGLLTELQQLLPPPEAPPSSSSEFSLISHLPESCRTATSQDILFLEGGHALEYFRTHWTTFGNFKKIEEVLDFWRSPPHQLGPLQPLAKYFLSIPATSAASESIASIMGRIKTVRSARMSEGRLIAETTICVNHKLYDSVEELLEVACRHLKNPLVENDESEDDLSSDYLSESDIE